MHSVSTIWLTGLSCAGKTTLARSIADFLESSGTAVDILDGKDVRRELGDFFGFSRDERMKMNRVLCAMARLSARHGVIPIVTAITPYQESRDFNRRELTPYLEIYVDCPVDVCAARDPHGLYEKALRGDLKHFVGVDDPYEIPKSYDFRIATAVESEEKSKARVKAFLGEELRLEVRR